MPVDPVVPIVHARTTAPTVKPPASKPVPLLQQNGFAGTIDDFNERVQAVHDAHTKAVGYPPSPALTLAVARNAEPHDYPGLFARTSHQHAETVTALGAAGVPQAVAPTSLRSPNPDRQQAQLLVKALGHVRTPEQLNAFLDPSNHEMIDAALSGPDTRLIQAAYVKAQRRAGAVTLNVSQQGFSANPGSFLDKLVGESALAAAQIATGLVLGPPTLAIAEGRAIGKAFSEGSLKPVVETNVKLGKGIVEGVKRDVTHPKENPGNLILDALGFASFGAGAVTRFVAAGRVLGEEGGVAALKTAARRPVGGTATLRKGSFEEEQLLTENPALRWAQRKLVDARNVRMAERTDEPGAMLSIVRPQRLQDALDLALDPLKANFSSENKLGREAKARRRIETTIQMTLKRDLDQVAGWTQTAATAFQRINKQLPERMRGLTVGEQKAIQVLATDDLDPFGAWRRFHQNMIDLEIGDPAAHRANIAAIKLAEEVVANPRPRFTKALELTRQVIEEQQQIKIDELGLRAGTAESRVVGEGEYVRRAAAATSKEELAAIPRPGLLGKSTTLRGYHGVGGGNEGTEFFLAHDARVARAYSERNVDVTAHEFEARHPLILDDRKEADRVQGLANAWAKRTGYEGQYPLAGWARSQGNDAIVRHKGLMGEYTTLRGVSHDETIILDPSRLKKLSSSSAALKVLQEADRPRLTEWAFYSPKPPKGKPRRATSERLEAFSPQAGLGGIPIPSTPAELTHEFSGAAIRAGDFRIDATSLAGETFARTVKAATKMNEWRRLWDAGTDTPRNLRFDRPVRDIKDFPDELRAVVNKALDAELTGEEALSLHPTDIKDLERFLFPGENINGRWRLDKSIEHVKWVDSRLLDRYRQPLPAAFRTSFQLLNEPFRDFALFLRPAYILNLVGNVGMGLIDQGVLLPANVLRAVRLEATHGERIAKTIDALGGASGRSASYAPANLGEGIGKALTTPGRGLARAWNTITDLHLRRAAILNHLRRQLVKAGKDPNDYEAILFDPELAKARNEGVRRGNKAMVEFDNQTWLEREALRHLIFVYPWQSRALVWSIRTIVEHPVQTAILDQIGQQAEDEFPHLPGVLPGVLNWDPLRRAPDWFKQIGYVPLGYNKDGTPTVVNASSVNTLGTFAQLLYPVEAAVSGSQYSSLADLFGPGATFLIHGATGKDQFGNTYPGSQWLGAAKEVWGQLPQLRAGHQKEGQPLTPIDISDRNTLIRRLNSGLKQTVFTPGWLSGYGTLISGGLTPRTVNPMALEARWYRDLNFTQRHAVEMDLIHRALGLQADLVKQKLPPAVKEAVDLSGERQVAYDALKTELGRTPTAKEQLQADITLFAGKAKLNDTDAALLQKKLAKITDPLALDRFRAGLYDKYANAKDLQQWDEHVRFVYSFRPEILHGKLAALKSQGLVASTRLPADQETLYAWGRKSLAFYAEAKQRSDRIARTEYTLPSERTAAEAELRVWADSHDKPVVVDGHTLPSPVRIAWANNTPAEQQQHLRSAATRSWGALSNFDKTLLGVKPDAVVSEVWATLDRWVADAQAALPVGQHLPAGARAFWANTLAQRVPAFRTDLKLSRQILAERLGQLRPVKRSPHAELWTQLLSAASGRYRQLVGAGWSKSQAADQWRRNDAPQLRSWVDEHPAFAKEVDAYGASFLGSLVRGG